MKKLISYILLIAISFSIAHGVVLDTHEDEHCSIQEFVAEFSEPVSHDDLHEHENDTCDSHYIFHVSFLLPDTFALFSLKREGFVFAPNFLFNPLFELDNSFRPPIA